MHVRSEFHENPDFQKIAEQFPALQEHLIQVFAIGIICLDIEIMNFDKLKFIALR